MSDERTETEMSEMNEASGEEGYPTGDSVPRPLGFIAFMPIPVHEIPAGAQRSTKPQPGFGPGIGAQVASQQSPVLRSGRS